MSPRTSLAGLQSTATALPCANHKCSIHSCLYPHTLGLLQKLPNEIQLSEHRTCLQLGLPYGTITMNRVLYEYGNTKKFLRKILQRQEWSPWSKGEKRERFRLFNEPNVMKWVVLVAPMFIIVALRLTLRSWVRFLPSRFSLKQPIN